MRTTCLNCESKVEIVNRKPNNFCEECAPRCYLHRDGIVINIDDLKEELSVLVSEGDLDHSLNPEEAFADYDKINGYIDEWDPEQNKPFFIKAWNELGYGK